MRLRSQTPSYYSFGEKRDDQSNLWNLVQNQLVFQHAQGAVKVTWRWLWKDSVLFTAGPRGSAARLRVGQQGRPSVLLRRAPWGAGDGLPKHVPVLSEGLLPLPSKITQTTYSEELNQRIKKSEVSNPTPLGFSRPGFLHVSAPGLRRALGPVAQCFLHWWVYRRQRTTHEEPAARTHETVFKL